MIEGPKNEQRLSIRPAVEGFHTPPPRFPPLLEPPKVTSLLRWIFKPDKSQEKGFAVPGGSRTIP